MASSKNQKDRIKGSGQTKHQLIKDAVLIPSEEKRRRYARTPKPIPSAFIAISKEMAPASSFYKKKDNKRKGRKKKKKDKAK